MIMIIPRLFTLFSSLVKYDHTLSNAGFDSISIDDVIFVTLLLSSLLGILLSIADNIESFNILSDNIDDDDSIVIYLLKDIIIMINSTNNINILSNILLPFSCMILTQDIFRTIYVYSSVNWLSLFFNIFSVCTEQIAGVHQFRAFLPLTPTTKISDSKLM